MLTETSVQSAPMTLEQARDAILALAAQQHTNHYRIGLIYNYVVEHQLAEKHAKKSAQEYFNEHVKTLSQTLLSICGAVAHAFSEEACQRFGVYNLKALMSYAKAAGLKLSKDDPGPTPILVPHEDGTFEQKAFKACSVEEINLAARHKRAPAATTPSEEEQARIQALRDSVSRHFAKDSSRTRVNSRVYMGTTYVTLQDVPVAELERLAEAVVDGITAPSSTS